MRVSREEKVFGGLMLSGIGKGGGKKSYNGGVYAELGAIVQISPEYSTFFLFIKEGKEATPTASPAASNR